MANDADQAIPLFTSQLLLLWNRSPSRHSTTTTFPSVLCPSPLTYAAIITSSFEAAAKLQPQEMSESSIATSWTQCTSPKHSAGM